MALLDNMFPRHVLEYLVQSNTGTGGKLDLESMAHQHHGVSILFMDIVGFTSMSKEVHPKLVMHFLNELFSRFDVLCDVYGVHKVETAGDCYIVAGALTTSDEEGFARVDEKADQAKGCASVVDFAQAMLRHAKQVKMPHNGQPTTIRIGVHTGTVFSGLIGSKLPKFSLFGDAMNTSSRMESTCEADCIQISDETFALMGEQQRALFSPTGGVLVKGKGLMHTFVHHPSEEQLELHAEDREVLRDCEHPAADMAEQAVTAVAAAAAALRHGCPSAALSQLSARHSARQIWSQPQVPFALIAESRVAGSSHNHRDLSERLPQGRRHNAIENTKRSRKFSYHSLLRAFESSDAQDAGLGNSSSQLDV